MSTVFEGAMVSITGDPRGANEGNQKDDGSNGATRNVNLHVLSVWGQSAYEPTLQRSSHAQRRGALVLEDASLVDDAERQEEIAAQNKSWGR